MDHLRQNSSPTGHQNFKRLRALPLRGVRLFPLNTPITASHRPSSTQPPRRRAANLSRALLSLILAATSVFAQAANYTYDSGGHLVKAAYGGAVVTYTYDPAGHLISRATAPTRCDVTGDGQVSIADVQAVINMALGLIASTTAADFNGDGVVNVADVQTTTTVVLGTATCPN